MHESRIIIGQSCSISKRTFYPVLRNTLTTMEHGGVFSSEPVAVLIEEDDTWFFVPLDDCVDSSVLVEIIGPDD